MQHAKATIVLVFTVLLVAVHSNPLAGQSRQQQVANERAKSSAASIKACPLLTMDEVRKHADKWQAMELQNSPHDMGATCDYGGFVTVRVFTSAKPMDEIAWVFKNYEMENEKRQPISGFGSNAFIKFPKPQSKYQDEAALLVGSAGAKMFMLTIIPPEGKTPQSMQPQLEELAKKVMTRLR